MSLKIIVRLKVYQFKFFFKVSEACRPANYPQPLALEAVHASCQALKGLRYMGAILQPFTNQLPTLTVAFQPAEGNRGTSVSTGPYNTRPTSFVPPDARTHIHTFIWLHRFLPSVNTKGWFCSQQTCRITSALYRHEELMVFCTHNIITHMHLSYLSIQNMKIKKKIKQFHSNFSRERT